MHAGRGMGPRRDIDRKEKTRQKTRIRQGRYKRQKGKDRRQGRRDIRIRG